MSEDEFIKENHQILFFLVELMICEELHFKVNNAGDSFDLIYNCQWAKEQSYVQFILIIKAIIYNN